MPDVQHGLVTHAGDLGDLAVGLAGGDEREDLDLARRERGWGDPTYESFVEEIEHGALFVGSPETVAQKIYETVRTLDLDRFDFKYAYGPMPHEQLMTSLNLYGSTVLPRVREMLSRAS